MNTNTPKSETGVDPLKTSSKSEGATMSIDTETPISRVDRKTASKINPAICDSGMGGTCHNVQLAIRALSAECVVEALDDGASTLLYDMLAAALDYEVQPVTRVK